MDRPTIDGSGGSNSAGGVVGCATGAAGSFFNSASGGGVGGCRGAALQNGAGPQNTPWGGQRGCGSHDRTGAVPHPHEGGTGGQSAHGPNTPNGPLYNTGIELLSTKRLWL